jgi:hypothetical protein
MSIKSFNEFTDEIVNENDVYGAAGKTKFSRWLRNVNSRVKEEMGDTYYSKYYDDHNDPYKTAKMATNLIPNTIRLITGAGAAIADFFSKGDNKDSFSKLSKHEIAGKKKEIIDKWETDNISNKKVTDADAERFYKSGVLKGKKYFGKEYDPANPKNKDEEMYTDYVNDVMERYHKKMGRNA